MCHLIAVTFPIHWANAERLSPDEPTQKDFPLILSQKNQKDWVNAEKLSHEERTQRKIAFLYAEPTWNNQTLNIYLRTFDRDV
jgi:hypothetical protein